MSTKTKKKRGCFINTLIIIGILLIIRFVVVWWSTRPIELLQHSLGVEYDERIKRVEGLYTSLGFDYTVQIYLEADPEIIEEILSQRNYEKTQFSELLIQKQKDRMSFEAAPPLPSGELIFYEEHVPTVFRYIVVSPERSRLWYAEIDY